jgi:AcrR family transcriptional regulator
VISQTFRPSFTAGLRSSAVRPPPLSDPAPSTFVVQTTPYATLCQLNHLVGLSRLSKHGWKLLVNPTSWLYSPGMPWDSQDTRRRLLQAAITEFSAYGIAGARVDRIASAAKANKQAIYAYFGSKDALFASAFEDRIRDFHATVLFDEYDLAEYAGRMFDKFEAAPETLRLVLWYQVERVAGPPLEAILDSNDDKVGRIVAAQQEGKVTKAYPAVALLSLTRSTGLMWHTQIPELAALYPSDRRDRRDMVVRVIRQVLEQ